MTVAGTVIPRPTTVDQGPLCCSWSKWSNVALAVSDRAYVMRQGRIVMEGEAAVLWDHRDQLEGHYLGSGAPA